jgi:hypothetical protein
MQNLYWTTSARIAIGIRYSQRKTIAVAAKYLELGEGRLPRRASNQRPSYSLYGPQAGVKQYDKYGVTLILP